MDNDIKESKSKQSLLTKIKSNKIYQYFIIAICLAVVIVLLFTSFFSSKKVEQAFSIDEYVDNLEKRLINSLSKVEGAGDVSVVVTVESGMETVLASKTTTTQSNNGVIIEEAPIIVNGKTITVMEKYPKVIGVLIVAEGAKNITVLKKLQQATISLLDININQIEILSMN